MNRTGPILKGTAFQWDTVQSNPTYKKELLAHGYKSLTPEWEMYLDQVQQTQGIFNFTKVDAQLSFAKSHGMKLRGHNLVWGLQLPDWITNPTKPWTRSTLTPIMTRWIKTVMGRYSGEISDWHIVNEALEDDGSRKPNIWQKTIGDDYIEIALRAAHSADPKARLFINEYSTEFIWPKSDSLLKLAKQLLDKKVPLHGIGFQMHSDTRWPISYTELKTNIDRFATLGLRTDVTELDVGTSHFVGTEAQKQAVQAQIYSDAANACEQSPSCWSFTTWGFTDNYTWLGTPSAPLPFDTNYQPKPAWNELVRWLG